MAQPKGKYWIANNPSAEVTDGEAVEVEQLVGKTPQLAVADIVVTQSSNGITGNDAVTIADGSAPSNDEIYELAIDTVTKLNTVLARLRSAGIIA